MEAEYAAALIGIGGVVLGIGITEGIGLIKRKFDQKEKFIMSTSEVRHQAYANIYKGLVDFQFYFIKVANDGNELIESVSPTDFSPLPYVEELNKVFQANELWIHQKIRQEVQEIINDGATMCSMAISICDNLFDYELLSMLTDQVIKGSVAMIESIDKIKQHIRVINGLQKLDELNNKVVSGRFPELEDYKSSE